MLEIRELQIPLGALVGPNCRPMYGYRTVTAKCMGGLAVHKAERGERWKYMVTHEGSGMAMSVLGAMTQKRALDNLREALALDFDWRQSADDIRTALKDRRDVVDALRALGSCDA